MASLRSRLCCHGRTAMLGKVGIQGVPSNLATAIRTVVILSFAWAIAIVGGHHHALGKVSRLDCSAA
jgi:transporter family protein